MRRIYKNRGSISIILLIILFPTLVFSGLMIDIARHYLSRSAIEQANRLTLNSVLASYDTVLKDVYGLFAISQDRSLSDRRRSELLKEQFIANMQNIILVSPVTEDIRVSPVLWSNYANPEVIEKGILEFMKYRGPAGTALSILDSLDVFSKIGEQSRVSEKRMDVELGYRDISAKCAELCRTIAFYDSQVEMYMAAEKDLLGCIGRIGQYEDKESEEYLAAYDDAQRFFHAWKEFSPAEMADYAISECLGLLESLGSLEQIKDEFSQSVDEYGRASDDSDSDEFYINMKSEMSRYDEEITPVRVEGLIEQLTAAKNYLGLQSFETVDEYITTAHNSSRLRFIENQSNNRSLYYHSEDTYLKLISEVINVEGAVVGVPALYITLLSSFGSTGDVGEFGSGKSFKKGISELNDLARQEATVEEAYAYSRYLFIDSPSSEQVQNIPEYFDDIDEGGWYGVVSQYREMLSKVSGLVTVLEGGVNELIGNLYISEYVIRNFSYLTSDADQMTMTGVPIDPEHNRIYGCEAEYILFGNKGCAERKLLWFTLREEAGPESNLATAKTSIFAIRFLCNSIFALTDSSLNEVTLAPALAIQAASGGILPYQLAQLTIKLALALAESAIDLDTLVRGERVPLLKSSSTWKCSVQGIIEMLKGRVSTEVSEFVDESVQKAVGFLQQGVDNATELLDTTVSDFIGDISSDLEIAISAELNKTVDLIMSVLLEFSRREFDSVFTTGVFVRERFVQTARTIVNSLMQNEDSDLIEKLQDQLPYIENDVINQMADIFESLLSDENNPSNTVLKIDQVLCRNISSELNECISKALERIKNSAKGEIDEILSSAGNRLRNSVEEKEEVLTEAVVEKLTATAIDILNDYIPSDMYTTEEVSGLGLELCEMKPGRINERILSLSYEDYLQILLVMMLGGTKRDEVLLRIADVMQLNVSQFHSRGQSFRMAEAYTCVEITGQITVHSFLLPQGVFDICVESYDIAGY